MISYPHPPRSGVATVAALFAVIFACLLPAPLQADALYRPPNMEKEIFNPKKIKLDKFASAQLVDSLVSVAADFNEEDDDVDFTLRAHALAIAGRLNADSKKFAAAMDQLQDDGETIGEGDASKSRTANLIFSGARGLARVDNADNKKCAAFCVDIALKLDPDGKRSKNLAELRDKLSGEEFSANWAGMLGRATKPKNKDRPWFPGGNRSTFEEREEVMPGGKAEKFQLKQSSVFGLVVITLNNGKHAGAASEIIATALRDEGSGGLKFKLNQKVGAMMANSLESIISFLRVTYEDTNLVPSDYTVEIVFEDKDTLTDGPSAGTAMTLMLESLFTGEGIDPKFACTGGITPNGKVTKIGGVAAKIRGATRRDCTIVGVPAGNAKGVADNLILHGIDQLLKIQIFGMKDIKEARAISRAEKSPEVQEALDSFAAVASIIEEKGDTMIKNAAVHKKLEEVVSQMPNHLSAKLLLQFAKGEAPTRLSVGGSFHEIDSNASGVFSNAQMMTRRDKYDHSTMLQETAKEAVKELSALESKVDKRMDPYLKHALVICKMVLLGKDDGDEDDFLKELEEVLKIFHAERKKLLDDPELREEIMG